MSDLFTSVEIAFYPEYVNHWLRFGEPDDEFDLDRRRAIAFFKPDRVFGYMRWLANAHGTQVWRFSIVRSGRDVGELSRIEGVNPGGEVLLVVAGKAKVKRALSLIDALEDKGFDTASVSADYFQHVHNRIAVGRPVHTYSVAQHEAYLAAKRVGS